VAPPLSLAAGAAELGLSLDSAQLQRLEQYLALLRKWNRAFNLVAPRTLNEAITLHVLDSLAVAPHVSDGFALDIGSGAGLPGIPLAIALPHVQWTLLDSNGKKTRFLQQCMLELQIPNVEVVLSRVELYKPERRFDVLVTRAVASAADLIGLTAHLWADETRMILMKSRTVNEEVEALPEGYVGRIMPLTVPGLNATRVLFELNKKTGDSLVGVAG